jgi:imidazolonepropionase
LAQYVLLRGAKQLLTLRGPSSVRRGSALQNLAIIEDGSVLIRDGIIAELGPSRRVDNLKEARNALEISASGFIVCPGFVDANVGLSLHARGTDSSGTGKPRKLSDFYNDTLFLMRSCLQQGTLAAGLKISADAAEPAADVPVLRQAVKVGQNPLYAKASWRVHRSVADDALAIFEEVVATVTRRRLVGSVEFLVRENSVKEQLIACVRKFGLSTELAWAGDSPDVLNQAIAASGTRAVSVLTNLSNAEASVFAQSDAIAVIATGNEMNRLDGGSLRHVVDSGAAIALSSGYDSRHSPGFSMEVALAMANLRGGLTLEEAFTAATVNAAHALGCAGVAGTLEAGKRADMLVLTVPDYREIPREFGIGHVGMVIRNGALVLNRTRWKMGA